MRWRWKRFGDAARGIGFAIRSETHLKVQLLIGAMVVVAGLVLGFSKWHWLIVILCISLVIALEILNTAIEHLCNLVHPDYHPMVGRIKDMAAGAVLVAAIGSCIIGGMILLPYMRSWLEI